MSKQDKQQLASDRQRRERLKRQLRLLYDDVAREDVPDSLMALVDQIGKAGSIATAETPADGSTDGEMPDKKDPAPL